MVSVDLGTCISCQLTNVVLWHQTCFLWSEYNMMKQLKPFHWPKSATAEHSSARPIVSLLFLRPPVVQWSFLLHLRKTHRNQHLAIWYYLISFIHYWKWSHPSLQCWAAAPAKCQVQDHSKGHLSVHWPNLWDEKRTIDIRGFADVQLHLQRGLSLKVLESGRCPRLLGTIWNNSVWCVMMCNCICVKMCNE